MTTLDLVRGGQVRSALRYEYAALGWNLFEGVVAVFLGVLAGSVALIGFGVDSFVEMMSGSVMVWLLLNQRNGEPRNESKERLAIRLIGVSFLVLAAYVIWSAVGKLLSQTQPDSSLPGMILAGASLVIMPWIAAQQRRIARQLDSGALMTDAKQLMICTYLSLILLGGLVANALFGWWWADPLAALLMSGLIVREGYLALTRQEICCT